MLNLVLHEQKYNENRQCRNQLILYARCHAKCYITSGKHDIVIQKDTSEREMIKKRIFSS